MPESVFSTHVEMFHPQPVDTGEKRRFLHARGDVSVAIQRFMERNAFSPRTWRCFQIACLLDMSQVGFLHARGDVSAWIDISALADSFSPRTWRCFQLFAAFIELTGVFSTHVEMFLPQSPRSPRLRCFLHARGDVSAPIGSKHSLYTFSPRTWRCFCSLTSVNLPG